MLGQGRRKWAVAQILISDKNCVKQSNKLPWNVNVNVRRSSYPVAVKSKTWSKKIFRYVFGTEKPNTPKRISDGNTYSLLVSDLYYIVTSGYQWKRLPIRFLSHWPVTLRDIFHNNLIITQGLIQNIQY